MIGSHCLRREYYNSQLGGYTASGYERYSQQALLKNLNNFSDSADPSNEQIQFHCILVEGDRHLRPFTFDLSNGQTKTGPAPWPTKVMSHSILILSLPFYQELTHLP